MFKYYIVTWAVFTWHMTGCPVPEPVVDKFGRVYESHIQEAIVCGITDSVFHKQRFDNRDSAYAFYKEAKANSDTSEYPLIGLDQSIIRNVKIDSVTGKTK